MDYASSEARSQAASAPSRSPADHAVGPATKECALEGLNAPEEPETFRRPAASPRVPPCAVSESEPLLGRGDLPNGIAHPARARYQRPQSIVKTSTKFAFEKSPDKKEEDANRPVLHVQFHNGAAGEEAPARECPSPTLSTSSSSSSSSDDDSSVALAEARPPDGGYGWVVVFASFMVNLIADGVTFSFGVIFVHFLDYFGEGKAKTAWIGSLFMSIPLLSGPIASFLTDRYGCRKVTIAGALMAAAGFFASSFAPSIEMLFFTFGVLAGFGLSLCYVAAVVIVAYYFDNKRSMATGLSVCGSGIGTFLFAPLTQCWLDEYGWRGTTLLLSGCFLNMVVCGALMRDLPWTTTMLKAKARDQKRTRERRRQKRLGSAADSLSDSKSSTAVSGVGGGGSGEGDGPDEESGPRHCRSLVDLPTFVDNPENVPLEVLEMMSHRRHMYNVLTHNFPGVMVPSRSFSDSGRLAEGAGGAPPAPPPSHAASPPAGAASPPGKQRILQLLKRTQNASPNIRNPHQARPAPAFLKDLRMHRHSLTYRGAMLNINRYRLRASSCPDIYRNSMTTIAKEKVQWYAGLWDLWDLIRVVVDFSHFANTTFLIFSMSNFLLYMWYDVPYVYVSDYAISLGFTEKDAAFLISIIGIVNMVGEIFLGWAGDWEWVSVGAVYAVCMVACGGVTAAWPWLIGSAALASASAAFGLFIAANYALTSIILVELISLENFTNAYGLLLLVQGVANLIGPPLAGWFYDMTGDYRISFVLSGIFIALSGLMLYVLPATKRVKRYYARRKRNNASESTSDVDDNTPHLEAGHIITTPLSYDKKEKVFY